MTSTFDVIHKVVLVGFLKQVSVNIQGGPKKGVLGKIARASLILT